MTTRSDQLRAELAVAEAEEVLVAAKAAHQAGDMTDAEYRDAKDEARRVRADYRDTHRADAAPAPKPAKAATKAKTK